MTKIYTNYFILAVSVKNLLHSPMWAPQHVCWFCVCNQSLGIVMKVSLLTEVKGKKKHTQ